jgi:serine/threonine-protein kinase
VLSEEELKATLDGAVSQFGALAATIAADPHATLDPEDLRPRPRGPGFIEGLERGDTGSIEGGLAFGATVGEGGMGIVWRATQRSLGRAVAVKTVRPELTDKAAPERLLREAWVTGLLEHPNIVPVYDLGLAADGRPLIVLRMIEGRSWAELIHDPAKVRELFGADDTLEYNLRILIQLCNAVSLAHARGIIHRDIKPDNVMIGRFGEVYVVDWGIAVSLRDDPSGRLPLAADAREAAGTPAYMAPEMLGGRGELGEHTDVYLLGATLYELLAGRPPHVGAAFRDIMLSIITSKPELPQSVPAELAAISTRAMSRVKGNRFESAEAFRQQIEWYLRHRGSLALSEAAARRVDEMGSVLADGDGADQVRDRLYRLFAEARFGFRQAINACGDNDAARIGLHEATAMMVSFELANGQPEAAAAALAELERPPEELTMSVAAAMRTRDAQKVRVADLEKLGADLDPATDSRMRIIGTIVFGAASIIALEVLAYVRPLAAIETQPDWTSNAITALFALVAVTLWRARPLAKTALNRRTTAATLLTFALMLTIQVGAHLLGVPRSVQLPLTLFPFCSTAAVYALFVDRRFWPTMGAAYVVFFEACIVPAHGWHGMAVFSFVLTVNAVIAWRRMTDARAHDGASRVSP